MRLQWEALKMLFICSIIVISSQRSTNRNNEAYNDEDEDLQQNDSDQYFNGGEDNAIDEKLQITEKDLPNNGELFEGDMVMDNGIRRAVLGEESKKAAIYSSEEHRSRHWPGGVVPYKIDDSLIHAIRIQIPTAVKMFNHFTCVKFVPWQPGDIDYINIRNGRGCSSSVGRQGGEQSVHLGKGCKRFGTVMHEMMHALGIIHEQSRPDRDQYLKINFKNIKDGLLNNFQRYSFDRADTLDLPYNYYSNMHYSNHAFSRNGEDTLKSKVDPDLEFGQRKMISHLDAVQINRLYKCHKDLSKISSCVDTPCGGRDQCCLIGDETPMKALHDMERKKKDALRRGNQEEWEESLVDILDPHNK